MAPRSVTGQCGVLLGGILEGREYQLVNVQDLHLILEIPFETAFKIRISSSSSSPPLLFLLIPQSHGGIQTQECLSQETRCWVEFMALLPYSEHYPSSVSFPSLCSPKPLPAQAPRQEVNLGGFNPFYPSAPPHHSPIKPFN